MQHLIVFSQPQDGSSDYLNEQLLSTIINDENFKEVSFFKNHIIEHFRLSLVSSDISCVGLGLFLLLHNVICEELRNPRKLSQCRELQNLNRSLSPM